MTSATLLPGVYFQTAIPAVPEVLPRLDIPAFVGFAASGPLHIPVVVEDAAYFNEIFGNGQLLARDPSSGQMISAQLTPAISTFFRNGGRRCWVVRVARKFLSPFEQNEPNQAQSNEFLVPGLLQLDPSGTYEAAWLEARSEGSWSDGLEVNTTLSYSAIEFVAVRPRVGGYELELDPASPISSNPGDVLEVVFLRDGTLGLNERDTVAYLPVERLETRPVLSPPGHAKMAITGGGAWFDAASPDDFPSFVSSPPTDQSQAFWLPLPSSLTLLTRQENQQLSPIGWGIRDGQFFFLTSRSDAQYIQSGSWLRADFATPVGPAWNILLIQVQEVHGTTVDPGILSLLSPPSGDELVEIVAGEAWWQIDGATAAGRSQKPLVSADVVTLELWVRDATQQVFEMSNLGLSALNPRYLGNLPTDAQLFSATPSSPLPADLSLIDDVSHPRFALGAPEFGAGNPMFVPLGVPGLVNEDFYEQAVPPVASALERDGLKKFSPDLFIDPDLSGSTVDTLLTEGFHKQYQLQRDATAGTSGEPLQGIHAILPIDEVSVLCVPDAPNRRWQQVQPQANILGAPSSLVIAWSGGDAVATWNGVPGALNYLLEQSLNPRFANPSTVWEGTATQSGSLPLPDSCSTTFYYRVRANGSVGPGPWSVTQIFSFAPGPFAACDPGLLDAPSLSPLMTDRGRTVLEWTGALGADSFLLQNSLDPTFELGSTLYQGAERTFTVAQSAGSALYYRVAAQRGTTLSPWSNTIFTLPVQTASWELEPLSGSTLDDVVSQRGMDLSTIHGAMLQLCAARGDVVSLLSVPQDFETDACVLYRQQLAVREASDGGDRTLSFGAFFHPWLIVSDSPSSLTTIVPDGSIAGIIAARTIEEGAWYSPAYRILNGVLGLAPALPASSRGRFFTAQINLLEQDPRGFIAGSSATLSGDSELTEFTVRRLLILLRRLALRDGNTFVFEPNDASFQRRVRRQFEDLLRALYVRGAFAGASPDQAFRVVADSSVNTQGDLDQGRFIVELRVAPSRPLAFLTVRLVQTGSALTVSEGS